jgi:hypothetical protein
MHGKRCNTDLGNISRWTKCKAEGLNVTSVLELAGVRDRFLVGCEDCASHIIPDLALIKNKVQRAGGASAKRPANRLGNPLLVRKK